MKKATTEPKATPESKAQNPSPEEQENASLLAKHLDDKGDVKGDFSMPDNYAAENMALLRVDHLQAYHQAKESLRAARAIGDHARAEGFYKQIRFNQLTIALIDEKYPKAKELADQIMEMRARDARAKREAFLEQEED